MKTQNQWWKAFVMAAVCAGLAGSARAADESQSASGPTAAPEHIESQKDTGFNQSQAQMENQQQSQQNQVRTDTGYKSPVTGTGTIGAANKASRLIGMEVKNPQNERLGKITDLAVDLSSGKISYAVLDGGTVFQSKLFAVPLSAFTLGADEKYLILNADKTKMASAQGFDKNSWPSLGNPDWGANNRFWEEPSGQSQRLHDMDGQQHQGTDTQLPMQDNNNK